MTAALKIGDIRYSLDVNPFTTTVGRAVVVDIRDGWAQYTSSWRDGVNRMAFDDGGPKHECRIESFVEHYPLTEEPEIPW